MATIEDMQDFTIQQLQTYTIEELEETFATRIELSDPGLLYRVFKYNSVDYRNFVISYGTISRDAKNIIAGTVDVELANTDSSWDVFLMDDAGGEQGSLYKEGVLKINLPAGKKLFTGYADTVTFDGAVARLTFKDKLSKVLDKTVGSEESPVDYYSSSYNPADLVWAILTTYGGIDSTASTANVDIDYTQWSAWKTDCTALDFSLEANCTGETIGELIHEIAYLTASFIYVDGTGKFTFYRLLPNPTEAIYEIDSSKYLMGRKLVIERDRSDLVNDVTCYYDLNVGADTWADSVDAEDTDSQDENWGTVAKIHEEKVVWHATEASAQEFCNRQIDVYSYPLELVTFTMPLSGADRVVGERLDITMPMPGGYTNMAAVIWRIDYDIMENATAEIMVRNASGDILDAFRLDHATLGLLDESTNPLY